jgi:hypothetical protein
MRKFARIGACLWKWMVKCEQRVGQASAHISFLWLAECTERRWWASKLEWLGQSSGAQSKQERGERSERSSDQELMNLLQISRMYLPLLLSCRRRLAVVVNAISLQCYLCNHSMSPEKPLVPCLSFSSLLVIWLPFSLLAPVYAAQSHDLKAKVIFKERHECQWMLIRQACDIPLRTLLVTLTLSYCWYFYFARLLFHLLASLFYHLIYPPILCLVTLL